jgi:hypothetical protein
MKSKQLLVLSIFYFFAIVSFSIYWAYNYSDYGTRKGDEFVTLAGLLPLITFGFFLVIYLFIARIYWPLLIYLPVVILIITVVAGTTLLLLLGTTGARIDIIGYGIIYGLLGISIIYLFFYKPNSKNNHLPKSNA